MKSTETILAEIQKDLTHILKDQSRMIESYNGKFEMTDDRITRVCDKAIKLEERITEAEKVQAVRISNMTKVIAGLAIGATLFCERIWHFIIS